MKERARQELKVLPVIHHLDRETSLKEVAVAHSAGADGVFLISHKGRDDEICDVAREAKVAHGAFRVGINLLSRTASEAAKRALAAGLDMVWADDMGVDSSGLDEEGRAMSAFAAQNPSIQLFASVAFKYKAHEAWPAEAARNALGAGFIPTTSGPATGKAPNLVKISAMGLVGPLAIASGMTPENIATFAPHLKYVLVATGVSRNEYLLDPERLELLIANAKAA